MIEVSGIQVFGWEVAITGMRNPMNSWDRSDSYYDHDLDKFIIGKNDCVLMRKLTAAGPEHRKFLRMIHVQIKAVIAPLYWWKEFDTYKIGTVANSCSTMHKIHAKEFTLDDFSFDHAYAESIENLEELIKVLNGYRDLYLDGKRKNDWWQLIQLLPSSYNQLRTVDFNYETALAILHQRSGHKLDEWRDFVKILKESLPYLALFSEITEGKEHE